MINRPLQIISLLVVLLSAQSVFARDARQMDTVVELYTSQGCSSCPPADAQLAELIKNPAILGLSFPVTYWDYIGWKDTLASPINDARQVQYKDHLNTSYVYTPQMVIAGQDHFVGSSSAKLLDDLELFKGHAQKITLKWQFTETGIEVMLPPASANAVIWQMDIDQTKEVAIGRGENTGRTITYHNVVRKIENLGTWDGTAKSLKLSLENMVSEGRDSCALIIQENGYGPIIAALLIKL